MNVYRESARHAVPRAFVFRRRGGIGPALAAVALLAAFSLVFAKRTHVECSRSADRCDFETFGLGGNHGSVRLSRLGALVVQRDRHGLSRLAFATTGGTVPVGSGSWDDVDTPQKAALADRFEAWRAGTRETFDAGYGPSPVLVAMALLTVLGAALWIARGGPAARVLVEPQSDTVTVVLREKPWMRPETRTFAKARVRPWKGAFELYDEAGNVVPLPVATTDARGHALEALLTCER